MGINTNNPNTNYQNPTHSTEPYQQPNMLSEKETLLPGWLWLVLAIITLIVAYASYDTYRRVDRQDALMATTVQSGAVSNNSEHTAAAQPEANTSASTVENTQTAAPTDTSAANEGAMGTTAGSNPQSPAAQQ